MISLQDGVPKPWEGAEMVFNGAFLSDRNNHAYREVLEQLL